MINIKDLEKGNTYWIVKQTGNELAIDVAILTLMIRTNQKREVRLKSKTRKSFYFKDYLQSIYKMQPASKIIIFKSEEELTTYVLEHIKKVGESAS